ncbi:MAG: hypothetical protein KKH34_01890, partial [Candidatus Omnitrophica bacterium]|nr:hypothetical protein [Candidatus Omnitrophota bacterium]
MRTGKGMRIIAGILTGAFIITSVISVDVFAERVRNYKTYCWNDGNGDTPPEPPEPPGQPGDSKNPKGSPTGGEPVNLYNGNFTYHYQDLFIPSRGFGIDFTRYYNTQDEYAGPFGQGWTHSYNISLIEIEDETGSWVLRRRADGDLDTFEKTTSDTEYTATIPGCYDTLKKYAVFPAELWPLLPANLGGGYHIRDKHGKNYIFDAEGKLRVIADRNQNKQNLCYGSAGKLARIVDTAGREITFSYGWGNKITSVSDFSGRTVKYAYTANGMLGSVTLPPTAAYPEGETTTYSYDNDKQLISITDPEGNTYLTNTYDSHRRVIEQLYAEGKFQFIYGNLMTTFIDCNANRTDYYFNPDGSTQKKVVHVLTDGSGHVPISVPKELTTQYTYNEQKEETLVIFSTGKSIEKEYDDKGNLLRIIRRPVTETISPLTTTMTYEPEFNMLKSVTDSRGNTTTYDYDSRGNLIKITYPIVNGESPLAAFTYTQFGELETLTAPNGTISRYEYSADTGYLSRVLNNYQQHLPIGGDLLLNVQTLFAYDSTGNLASVTDANNNTTTFEYDALNQLTRTVSPAPFNYETKFSYDRNGNLIRLERQANEEKTQWQKTEYEYDARDLLTAVKQYIDDLNFYTTTFIYDKNSNRTEIIDAEGKHTQYIYDGRDLLKQVIDAQGNPTTYRYDDNSNLTEIRDAKNNLTKYYYDEFDRVWKTEYPDMTNEGYVYDNNSNLIAKFLRAGGSIQYAYDSLNRLIQKIYPDTTGVTYTYDLASRLIGAQNPASNIQYAYDALNRVTQVTDQSAQLGAKTISYEYDVLGNRTKLTYPDNSYITYSYDEMNRLEKLMADGSSLIAEYEYDVLSRRKTLNYANGTASAYQYDNLNRLVSLACSVQPEAWSVNYSYDKVGNRITKDETRGTSAVALTSYDYDDIYQLIQVTSPQSEVTSYDYDEVGNREAVVAGTTTHYTTNNLNQYTSVDAQNLSYDTNGNLTAHDGWTYSYDFENRLLHAAGPMTQAASYKYDAFGRRVSKSYELSTTNFIYDGDQIIAEYDASGSLIRKYVYGTGIDEPIQATSYTPQAAGKYWYHADGLGSITSLTDDSGNVVE